MTTAWFLLAFLVPGGPDQLGMFGDAQPVRAIAGPFTSGQACNDFVEVYAQKTSLYVGAYCQQGWATKK